MGNQKQGPSGCPTPTGCGTPAPGEAGPLSNEQKVNAALMRIMSIIGTSTPPASESASSTGPTPIESEPDNNKNIGAAPTSTVASGIKGDTNMQSKTQNAEPSGNDGIEHSAIMAIQPTGLSKQSENALAEISRSTSLIGDSIVHLQGLMKSAAKQETPSPQSVNAACNCAKQMTSMIRLQVDMYREVRKATQAGLYE